MISVKITLRERKKEKENMITMISFSLVDTRMSYLGDHDAL